MLHIPILRHGKPYRSVDGTTIPDFRSRQPYASLSQANVGLIRRDLLQQENMRESLARIPVRDLIALSATAADHFLNSTLPIGEETQTPEDYVRQCSATTGLPHIMVRKNMGKIHGVMAKVEDVIRGLTRGVDLEVLDRGFTFHGGQALSFFPRGNSLGVVLPSNSPGVHSLWAPAFAMKTPLVLKPGGSEPWTPYRIIQAFIKAGAPPEAFCYYPTDHAGGGEILRSTGRGMLFGDVGVAKLFAGDPRIEIHGPGYSKILIAEDEIENWEKYLDVMVASIAEN